MSRARLQNLKEEYERIESERIAKQSLEHICNQVIQTAVMYPERKKLQVWTKHAIQSRGSIVTVSQPTLLNLILSGLQERFPDSNVQMDPLQTYILVDWS